MGNFYSRHLRLLTTISFFFSVSLLSQNTNADFPVFLNTGDPAKDADSYTKAKNQWINEHPDEYKKLNESNTNSIMVPIPEIAEQVVQEFDSIATNKIYDRTKEVELRNKKEAERFEKLSTMYQLQMDSEQLRIRDSSQPESMFQLKSPTVTNYMESVLIRIKEAEFPGNLMSFNSDSEQQEARKNWIQTNSDLYQLFVWVISTPDGKIKITKKEYNQLSPQLKSEVDNNISEYLLID